jgi:hypothetical protein
MSYETDFLSLDAGSSPAGMTTGSHVSVIYDLYITAPYSDVYKKEALCGLITSANTTLAGLPARYIRGRDTESTWDVGTSAALYQLDYELPGTPLGTFQDGSPTPLPQSTVQAAQGTADAVITSFRPIPATAQRAKNQDLVGIVPPTRVSFLNAISSAASGKSGCLRSGWQTPCMLELASKDAPTGKAGRTTRDGKRQVSSIPHAVPSSFRVARHRCLWSPSPSGEPDTGAARYSTTA